VRVLHILNELRRSGAETMLRGAGSYWKALGIEGEILCTGEALGSYATPLEDAGFRVHHLPFVRSVGFLHSIYRFFRSHRYDSVHIHTERGCFWYAGLAYLTGHRSVVRSLHGVFSFRGGLRARRYAQRLLMRRVFGVRMAAVSQSVKNVEQGAFRNPALVIPDWFDSNWYRPPTPQERQAARAAFAIDPSTLVISSVANCAEVKNHAAVLQAVARIPRAIDILYLHAGDERDDPTERALAEELGIAGRVRFLGPVADARRALHASDLFVMPSLREAAGVAAMEAMGAGVPVVLSDVEGLRDFRAMSPAIHWIEPTARGVEAAILHFHGLEARDRKEIGEQLSASAHRSFGIAAGAAQYAALYRGEQF
jgi:glycosyltransferase involved in cell wall biosynthesis